jgi:hypothetical protein
MINFSFRLSNPFSDRWATAYHNSAMLGKHTGAEIQVIKDNTIVDFSIRWTTRQDHAGVMLDIGLLGYTVMLHYYDTRHWNSEAGRFYNYDKAGNAS